MTAISAFSRWCWPGSGETVVVSVPPARRARSSGRSRRSRAAAPSASRADLKMLLADRRGRLRRGDRLQGGKRPRAAQGSCSLQDIDIDVGAHLFFTNSARPRVCDARATSCRRRMPANHKRDRSRRRARRTHQNPVVQRGRMMLPRARLYVARLVSGHSCMPPCWRAGGKPRKRSDAEHGLETRRRRPRWLFDGRNEGKQLFVHCGVRGARGRRG